jgi:hypothetical protein
MMSKVAEKMLCEAEGRRKARGLRRVEAMAGLGSSFVDTGLAALILSARAYADGWQGWFLGNQLFLLRGLSFVGQDRKAYSRG